MLDIEFILQNREIVNNAIVNKNGRLVDFNEIERLYTRRAELLKIVSDINHKRKQAADDRDVEGGKVLKDQLSKSEDELRGVTKELTGIVATIPNIPLPDVPIGKDEDDNVVIHQWGQKRDFSFTPKPHWELGKERDLIDSERAAKTSGARFTFLKGGLVQLQFAIIQWVMQTLSDEIIISDIVKKNNLQISTKPFIPILPPVMITPAMYFGMSRLDPKEDKYYLQDDDLYLIGSAEHTLGAMHAGETFEEKDLPIRYIGYSTAFRREAGSYGKDTKGILRQHQFDKLEMETFTVGEKSKIEQDLLVSIQEYFVQSLGLPYQLVAVCTGDMGGPDLRQIDIEIWMPGQDVYRETHSADLMGEYQSRRLGTKVKRDSGEKEFVHMNDATTFAIGRTLIAIIENNQQENGDIEIPEVLRPYMNGQKYI